MTCKHVSLERRGGIAIVRLDRPPANAIDMDLATEFDAAFEKVVGDRPGAIVLTGTGRFFSGGLDLKVVPTYSLSEQKAFLHTINRMIGRLYACPVPVVGAINGHAIAGAFVLVLTTDYRIGPDADALFGLTEARAGIPFPAAPMVVVGAELAPSDVLYTTLYARNFGPSEARSRGVLDELRPRSDVLERAVEVAEDIASMPADGYRRIKRQVRAAAIARIEQLIADDSDPMLRGWLDPGAREASAAILHGARDG
jgi:enoyl-CoA hydratase